ncbi:MAG: hypothetical protein ACPGVG_19895 [Mycobacterium sp.]
MSDPQPMVYRQASRTCETCGGHGNIVGGVWNGEDCPDCIDGRVTVPTTRPHCGMRHLTDLDRFRGYKEAECDHHHVPAPWAVILPSDPAVYGVRLLCWVDSLWYDARLERWEIQLRTENGTWMAAPALLAIDLDRIGDNPTRRAIPELMP